MIILTQQEKPAWSTRLAYLLTPSFISVLGCFFWWLSRSETIDTWNAQSGWKNNLSDAIFWVGFIFTSVAFYIWPVIAAIILLQWITDNAQRGRALTLTLFFGCCLAEVVLVSLEPLAYRVVEVD